MRQRVRICSLLILSLLLTLVLPFSTAMAQHSLLYLGSSGGAVRELQEALKREGHDPGPLDGIFGPKTLSAVIGFQRATGLVVDGIVGPNTQAMLGRVASVSRSERLPLAGKKIAVDPGHGGPNPGAIGVDGSYESHNVLAIGLILRDLLHAAGAEVVMTRTRDVEPKLPWDPSAGQLRARTHIVNASGADLFVSIHNNAYPKDRAVSGVMTFVRSGDAESKKLAQLVLEELVRGTSLQNRGMHTATFYVLRNTTMTAVLAEIGFMTNWHDARALQTPEMRQKAAEALFRGILRYYGYE